MMLTDKKIRSLKPRAKAYKVFDGGGMYLEILPDGRKRWRWKYRFAGKENRLSLGVYPEVSLKDARQRLEEERRILRGGEDPSRKRQEAKTAGVDKSKNTFEVVTLEWLAKFSGNWVPNHQTRVLGLFKNHVFPEIGAMPIADVTEKDLLDVLAKLQVVTEDRDKPAIDTAHRVRAYFGRIYRYALPSRRIKSDPTPALRDCLPPCQRGTSPP